MNRSNLRGLRALLLLLLGAACPPGYAQGDLTETSLEDLLKTGVTSVSKKTQALSDTAAAIHVITQEDIRRSGATRLTEVLAQAPGIEVGRIAGGIASVTIRGFSGQWANKLLVLIDGRSVYTQTFSGTYWDMQNLLLEDIERIEILRGPGSTLWGANAVNGVINIITRSARDTEGGLATIRVGTEDRGAVGLRYGIRAGDHGSLRFHARSERFDESVLASNGAPARDDSRTWRTGFRGDWELPQGDKFTIMGDAYGGNIGLARSPNPLSPLSNLLPERGSFSGHYILARWQRALSLTSDMSLQVFHDATERREYTNVQERVTDVEFQHRTGLSNRQELIWGLNYRNRSDTLDGAYLLSLNPAAVTQTQASLFVQDEIRFPGDRFKLTLGTRFEHSFWQRWEIQPNARLFMKVDDKTRVWAALSKAARTPARIDRDLAVSVPPSQFQPGFVYRGDPQMRSENVRTAEVGLRHAFSRDLAVDVSAYVSRYEDLRAVPVEFQVSPPMVVNTVQNGMHGTTRGIELSALWRAGPRWRLQGSASWIRFDLGTDAPDAGRSAASIVGSSPRAQYSLMSYIDAGHGIQLDARIKYVGALTMPYNQALVPGGHIDSYVDVDVRAAWRVDRHLELALIGRNLAAARRVEFSSESGYAITARQRGVYLKATRTF
jgi:iron complex outermembrane receptor protein